MKDLEFRAYLKNEKKLVKIDKIDFINKCITYNNGRLAHFMNIELMQFIGIKDKKGNKIFEDDIIKGWLGYTCNDVAVIEYEEESIGFVCNSIYKKDFGKLYQFSCNIEVIGNIYDNPELLEDK